MAREPRLVSLPDEERWKSAARLHDEAAALLRDGQAAGALPVAERALLLLVETVGPDHQDCANAHATLGEIHAARGRAREAIEELCAALDILDRFHAEPAVDVLRPRVASLLAHQLALTGEYLAAELLAHEAVRAAGTPADRAEAYNALGVVYRFQGQFREAAGAYDRARQALLGAGLPVWAALLHNLAGLACAQDRFLEAELLARKAIERRRRSEGEGLGLGTDLCGLGDALAGQGRLDEAEGAYGAGLEQYARFAPDHPEVAYALHNLGDMLAGAGRAARAEDAYREAVARKKAAFGRDHHEVAATLNNLAALLAGRGRRAEARVLSLQAVAIAERLAATHPVRAGVESLSRALAA